MIGIVTHAVYYDKGEIHGPADAISNYLRQQNQTHILLKHPLWGKHRSVLFVVGKSKVSKRLIGPVASGLLRYPLDIFLTIKAFYRLQIPRVIIGVDPLNCIGAILLKYLHRTDCVVYFTADFAIKRFPNPLLNRIYHVLDTICAKNADYCWSVSSRIVAYRRKQGVLDTVNVHIPNAPSYVRANATPHGKKRIYDLVIVSNLQAGVEFDEILKAVKQLRGQFPELRLLIIGGGPGEVELRKHIASLSLTEHTLMLGQLPHDKVHKILLESGIGIALYNDTAPWRYYSDSMKARDYLACGLPVIISGDLATVDDIVAAEAGMAIKPSANNVVKAISQIISDEATYQRFSSNARKLGKENDIDTILDNAFAKLNATIAS